MSKASLTVTSNGPYAQDRLAPYEMRFPYNVPLHDIKVIKP